MTPCEQQPSDVLADLALRIDDQQRGFELGPTKIDVGHLRFGGWLVERVPSSTHRYPGYHVYLVKITYALDPTALFGALRAADIRFEFPRDGIVLDVVPRSVTRASAAATYVLSARHDFVPANGKNRSSLNAIELPDVEPVLEISGVGGSGLRLRHDGGVRGGDRTAWLTILVPIGQSELAVRTSAMCSGGFGDTIETAADFIVRLPEASPERHPGRSPIPNNQVSRGVQLRLGFVVDVEGYSTRTEPQQRDVQRRLASLIDAVLDDVGVPRSEVDTQDSGDGRIVLLPTDIALDRVLPALLWNTGQRLAADNARHRDRIRMRMAADIGGVGHGDTGFTGDAVIRFCRLVNSTPIRQSLIDHPDADLAVLVSEWIYNNVVEHGYPGLAPAGFTTVTAVAKGYQAPAWLWVPAALAG